MMMSKKERYDKLYRCNVSDLIDKNFRQFQSDNLKDYIDKSIAYILKFRVDGSAPSPNAHLKIGTLIDTARREVAIKVAKLQIASDPKDLTNMHSENDLDVKLFISDPVGYMVAKLNDPEYYNSIKPGNFEGLSDLENSGYIKKYDKNKEKILSYISTDEYKVKYTAAENRKLYTDDILMLLGEKMPDTSINAELRRQKGGFWEKFLFRTSKQYKNFKKTLVNFTGVRNPGYGDKKAIKDTAMSYLKHKFPKLKDGELPTLEQIEKLDETGKARATFCYNVAKSCMEVEHADKVIDAVKGLNLGMDGLKKKEPEEAKFVDSEENLAARTKKIENSNMVEVLDRDNKKVIKKSSLKMPKKDNPNDIVRNKKHKRVIKFDVAGNAPKRYMDSNGNQVGGDGTVPKLPPQQRKIHVYEKHPMSTEDGIKEEQELKNEIISEAQNPKQIAPDNNEFLNELKADTEEKVINNEEMIDTSTSKQLPELEEAK